MKTIAQQLKIKKFPFEIKDSNGNKIYFEKADGFWGRYEYDDKGNITYFENSYGYWYKSEYDSKGNQIYYETSGGYWSKSEYDSNGNRIYYENANGAFIDKRPKIELNLKEIAEKFGVVVSQIKIKEQHKQAAE